MEVFRLPKIKPTAHFHTAGRIGAEKIFSTHYAQKELFTSNSRTELHA